jgi:RNA polymerase sigma-70 factor (ECF subfamily)
MREPADAAQRDLLDRYAAAFETADVTALMRLLREDAVFEMPPQPAWFVGRELIGRFLASRVLSDYAFRMLPITANGQPAFAAYMREGDGVFRAHAIQVLTVSAGRITRLVSFNDAGLFPAFLLPPTFPATAPGPG